MALHLPPAARDGLELLSDTMAVTLTGPVMLSLCLAMAPKAFSSTGSASALLGQSAAVCPGTSMNRC